MNDLAMRELYSSPNGDCWHLCRDASGYVFVLHQPNIPSGGRASRIELSDFVAHGRGPEQQALLHILGSLIEVDSGLALTGGREDRASVGARHGEDSDC
jgi:hypothetical protein